MVPGATIDARHTGRSLRIGIMPSVLFVCTANQCRSPVAAAAFQNQLSRLEFEDQWKVYSAGTWAVAGIHSPGIVLHAAERFGLRLDDHVTQSVNLPMLSACDLVLVMEKGHQEALSVEFPVARSWTYLLSQVVDGVPYDISDPGFSALEVNQAVQEMVGLIERGTEKICNLALELSKASVR